MTNPIPLAQRQGLDDERAIREICSVVSRITGIQLGTRQEGMVRSRLVKRLLELNLKDYGSYLQYFNRHAEEETSFLVSLLTTHHTFFFREFNQFEHLLKGDLKRLADAAKKRDGVLRVWSAACSRGQEVYTLAMFLDLHLPKIAPGVTYSILGTDVDEESVAFAQNGVYTWESLKEVPHLYWQDHWARGKGDIADFVKVRDSLKKNCRFRSLNLLKVTALAERFDLIFCRNVFIYFDPPTITSVTSELLKRLESHGLLFIGISETLGGLKLPVESRGLSIYAHAGTPASKAEERSVTVLPTAPQAAQPIRVLCVDDSPSILRMMQQILTKADGFEIVATAKNGVEAAERMKAGGIDAMTLDIHMPEMNGLEYLKRHMKPGHPPVIMVTSVAREDQSLALEALAAGAIDFVEKPSLADLSKKGEEIRAKLGSAVRARGGVMSTTLDAQFAQKGSTINTSKVAQVVVAQTSDLARLSTVLRELSRSIPTVLALTDERDAVSEAIETLKRSGHTAKRLDATQKTLPAEHMSVMAMGSEESLVRSLLVGRQIAMLVVGEKPPMLMRRMSGWLPHYVILEEGSKTSWESPHDRMPLTSFAYMSARQLGSRSK